MSTEGKDNFSEIIDITLYKYNSIDVKLWGIIQRDINSKKLNDESYLITSSSLRQYINKWFSVEINRFQSVSDITIHKEATSVYFLWKVLENIPKLSWLKVNLNKNASYSRIINIDQIKTIKYNIKTIRGSIRLFDLFGPRELDVANDILDRCKLLNGKDMFTVLRTKHFLSILDMYLAENNTNETYGVVNAIIQKLEPYEADDPEMLLITDRKSDI
jgi:hypothetical protein